MIDLKNRDLNVKINEHGAELSSILAFDDHLEYLWQANPKYWGRHAPVLFPIVGRLKDDQYRLNGKTYHMNQHGFARDSLFTVVEHDDQHALFELQETDETLAMYPFQFKLQLRYVLEAHTLSVTYRIENPNDVITLPFAIGGHPAFNVPLVTGAGDFSDYQITIAPKKAYEQIPLIGSYNDVTHEKTLNLTTPLQLTHELFNQDAIILSLDQVETTVMLSNLKDDHGIALTLQKAPFVGLWSPYPKLAPFVCIEPWWGIADNLASDGDFLRKHALQELAPKTHFEAKYQLRFF